MLLERNAIGSIAFFSQCNESNLKYPMYKNCNKIEHK